MSGVAGKYYEALHALNQAEEDVGNLLSEVLGEGTWSDFTADYYDVSIEIFGVSAELVLTEIQQAALWAAGFERCWMHVAMERSDNEGANERYYWHVRDGGKT